MSLPTKWRLKGCPRCGGDLSKEPAYREWICLQCGHAVCYGPDPELRREEKRR